MSYLALYRKYRPNSLDELVGQSDISKIIKNEILSNKISHAYLFSGPRGTGKTSTAKIIAKMINCFNLRDDGSPCGKCESCLDFNNTDVIEIDAASNNGVDEIRELRDNVNLVPTHGKYKVYIIDEVHMLTSQAFNALLKTLEEPPSHVVFILATTDFYKIPVTVVSRCQKFQFFKFTNDEIFERLFYIASLEKIDVDKSALYEIARISDGGLRDAINMLDQLSSFKNAKILVEDVYKLNGIVSYEDLFNLIKLINNGDVNLIINFINDIDKKGNNIDKFINDLIFLLENALVYLSTGELNLNIDEMKETIIYISDNFSFDVIYDMIFSLSDLVNKIKNSNYSSILLISYFIKLSNNVVNVNNKSINNDDSDNLKKDILDGDIGDKVNEKKIKNKKFELSNELKNIRINNSFATASKNLKESFIKKWENVSDNMDNTKYINIVAVVNDVEPLVVGKNNCIFLVKYDSLMEKIYNYIEDFENLLYDIFGQSVKVVFLTNDEWLYEKKKYIDNIRNGIKYEVINEKSDVSDVLDSVIDEDVGNDNLSKIISILGNDVVSYE